MILITISWQQYIFYLGAGILLYYLVLIVHRRKKGRFGINIRNKKYSAISAEHNQTENIAQVANRRNNESAESRANSNHVVYDLLFEIQSYLSAIGNEVAKDFILEDLSLIIKKYPALKETTFKETINNVISVSCENCCSVLLSENELRRLWEDSGHS